MPTRAQIEASRKRNRERGLKVDAAVRVPASGEDLERIKKEAEAGPRWARLNEDGEVDASGQPGVVDRWGGPKPPNPSAA